MVSLADLYTASDSDPTPVVEFLRRLAESYGLPRPLHVLDLGCGPGRLLAPLDRLRWTVVGVEPHPQLLAAARAAATSRRVTVRQGGFLDVDDRETFDLAIAVNSSFAHLLRPADRADALRRIHAALRPGGVVFLDLPDFLWILRNYRAPEPYEFTVHGRPVTLHREHAIDHHDATFTTVDEYRSGADGAPAARFVHVYGIVTFPELAHHLEEAGFLDLRTHNGYASPSDEKLVGPRMLVSARKPAG